MKESAQNLATTNKPNIQRVVHTALSHVRTSHKCLCLSIGYPCHDLRTNSLKAILENHKHPVLVLLHSNPSIHFVEGEDKGMSRMILFLCSPESTVSAKEQCSSNFSINSSIFVTRRNKFSREIASEVIHFGNSNSV